MRPYHHGIRADRVTERLLRKMKESGCVFVSYGRESGNQSIVNNMGKSLKLKKLERQWSYKVGIRNSVNFIIGHKDETYETAMGTIKFARTLLTNFVNFYNVIPYQGTDLYNWASKNASFMMPVGEYLSKVGSRDLIPVFETKEFPTKDRIKAFKKGYTLFQETVFFFL